MPGLVRRSVTGKPASQQTSTTRTQTHLPPAPTTTLLISTNGTELEYSRCSLASRNLRIRPSCESAGFRSLLLIGRDLGCRRADHRRLQRLLNRRPASQMMSGRRISVAIRQSTPACPSPRLLAAPGLGMAAWRLATPYTHFRSSVPPARAAGASRSCAAVGFDNPKDAASTCAEARRPGS